MSRDRCLECGKAVSRQRSITVYEKVDGPAVACGEKCLKRYNANTAARIYVGEPIQQSLAGIQEEFTVYPTHESDFAPTCPAEWSEEKAAGVAVDMGVRYGTVLARKKATRLRLGHRAESWGWKFWSKVLETL